MEQIKTHDQYAIFARGSKQYQAVEGKTLAIDQIEGEPGSKVEFKDVLFRKSGENTFEVGKPHLSKPVTAVIVKQMKGRKTIALRFKRRQKVRVSNNGRAALTVVRFETV
jgi:large subunit ribosomal protein L21